MSRLSVRLFGKLSVQRNGEVVPGLTASKVQELFCYLLLHRDRPHPREALASLLWGDTPTLQSKKYLRQSLWQLQRALKCPVEPAANRVLLIDSDWIQLNSTSGLELDVALFEEAFAAVRHVPIQDLDSAQVQALSRAADKYHGGLLEGSYQDWCLHERERLQNMYLAMLDKVIAYNELHREYETGITHATHILRYDRARECTHQRLMRLHYLAGDRAAALRQYQRCVAALDEELGVQPAEGTVALYEDIRSGRLDAGGTRSAAAPWTAATALSDVLGRLKQLELTLADFRHCVQTEIQVVENALIHKVRLEEGGRRPPARTLAVSPTALLRAKAGRERAG